MWAAGEMQAHSPALAVAVEVHWILTSSTGKYTRASSALRTLSLALSMIVRYLTKQSNQTLNAVWAYTSLWSFSDQGHWAVYA